MIRQDLAAHHQGPRPGIGVNRRSTLSLHATVPDGRLRPVPILSSLRLPP